MNVAERVTEIDLSTFSTRTRAVSDAIVVTLVGNASLFLRLLNSLAESNKTHKYSLRFRSNPGLQWQRRSLSAVRKYAQDLVVVE
jgi:hypothetical protein